MERLLGPHLYVGRSVQQVDAFLEKFRAAYPQAQKGETEIEL
jgi:hypothetical protein